MDSAQLSHRRLLLLFSHVEHHNLALIPLIGVKINTTSRSYS